LEEFSAFSAVVDEVTKEIVGDESMFFIDEKFTKEM
jgi:hypothetical protein